MSTPTTIVVSNDSPIRRFADSGIQSAVDKAVASLGPDKSGAVIAVASKDRARLAVVARLGSHWSALGVLDKPYNGPLSAEAAIRFSW